MAYTMFVAIKKIIAACKRMFMRWFVALIFNCRYKCCIVRQDSLVCFSIELLFFMIEDTPLVFARGVFSF